MADEAEKGKTDVETPQKSKGSPSVKSSTTKKAKGGKSKILMTKVGNSSAKDHFILDSGASRHMVTTTEILTDVKTGEKHHIYTANGHKLEGNLYGNLTLILNLESALEHTIVLIEVLEVEGLSDNLISVDALADKGVDCNFSKDETTLIDTEDGEALGYGESRSDGLRYLVCRSKLKSKACIASTTDSIEVLHHRLGHTAKSSTLAMIDQELVNDVQASAGKAKPETIHCECCIEEKITRRPFNGTIHTSNDIGGMTHFNHVGPMTPTDGGKKYMISNFDEKTRTPRIALLNKKSKTTRSFKNYKRYFELENGRKIKILKVDQGRE